MHAMTRMVLLAAGSLILCLALMPLRAQQLPNGPTWTGRSLIRDTNGNLVASSQADGNATKSEQAPAANTPKPSQPRAAAQVPQPSVVASPPVSGKAHKMPPSGSVILTNRSGVLQKDYPFQFARPFTEGAIHDFPQVVVDGAPVQTQADVKTRYPDGSVEHAILSLIIPSIPASGSLTLTFRNQQSSNNTPLKIDDMLDPKFDFDASIDASNQILSSDHGVRISAREMLSNAGNCADDVVVSPTALCAYWTKGPIATTIVLADHSAKRRYDFGFSTPHRAVRPIFHVTFWPGIKRVRVRAIGEVANTDAMQDEFYNLALKLGHAAPKTVYTKNDFVQHGATRWTKVFWIGGAPEERIDIDNNLRDLAATYLVANYDTSLSVEAMVNRLWDGWQRSKKDIGDAGIQNPYMPSTGGRYDIGNMPSWTVAWLYTGDWRVREIAMAQGELAGNWPLHAREGNPAKKLDHEQRVSALGRTVTVYARPSLWLFDGRQTPSAEDAVKWSNPKGFMLIDRVNGKEAPFFGRQNTGLLKVSDKYKWEDPRFEHYAEAYFDGWLADGAHQPDPFFGEYLVSGDYWYLEEMQFWAGAMSVKFCIEASYCRGPGAGIQTEVRGNAWVLRNRVNASVASPDSAPEKKVFAFMTGEAVALWEGQRNITGSQFERTSMWQFGRAHATESEAQSPLHFWHNEENMTEGLVTQPTPGTIPAKGGISPWMQNYLIIELGRAAELGFPTKPLLSWLGANLTGQLTSSGFNPYLCQAYRMPVTKTDGSYYSSWADEKLGFPVDAPAGHLYQSVKTLQNDITYISIARAAASMLLEEPQGLRAWEEINRILAPRVADIDPSWGIIPREKGMARH